MKQLRACEWVLVSYFAYIALLMALWRLPVSTQALASALPVALVALAYVESRRGNKATGVAREWIVPGLLLIAYQEMRWFERPSSLALEHRWIAWDRVFLDQWHVRAAVESWGALVPFALEFSYLLVYAIPALALGVLYRNHLRSRTDIFLFTFVLGTLVTYAALPYFPSAPPRAAFPGADLPHLETVLRRLNVWLLDRCDIRTSVFPSGHVTAAFSAAFGMLLAYPEKKRYGFALLALATMIGITTVYGRYHYLVDGIAGFLISVGAAAVSWAVFSASSQRQARGTPSISAAHAGD